MLARDYGVHSDSFTRAITTLWLGDEEERTELLSIIGPEADYEQTHGGDFASLYYGVRGLVQCESVDDKAITVHVSAYMECIDFDIRDFRKAIDARNPFGSTENPDNQ